MFVDTHCHLSELSDQELHEQLLRAQQAGVTSMIAIGLGSGEGLAPVLRTLEICKAQNTNCPRVFCALGFHPHEAKDMTDNFFEQIKNMVRSEPCVVAVGEVGLDYHYELSPREIQKTVLNRFIDLALSVKKPLAIHDRECGEDCIKILEERGAHSIGGQAHCFSGDWNLAQRYLNLGFYISVTGVVTFPKAVALRDVVAKIPLDRLLVETDSPYLAPVPHRGKPNEPAHVRFVVEALAKIRGMTFDEMAHITHENTQRLFGEWL